MTILVTLDEADLLLNAAVGTEESDERQLSSHYSQPKETHITGPNHTKRLRCCVHSSINNGMGCANYCLNITICVMGDQRLACRNRLFPDKDSFS
jgi:hypothetical protein